MKFLVSFQQKHISVFQLSKFSTPTQKSFPSFPVKDSQAAFSVVVSIVVGVHGEAQLPIALEQVIALSDSNPTSFCEHLCESENLTLVIRMSGLQMSIKHHQIRILSKLKLGKSIKHIRIHHCPLLFISRLYKSGTMIILMANITRLGKLVSTPDTKPLLKITHLLMEWIQGLPC